jgi:TonB family C-terminal domain
MKSKFKIMNSKPQVSDEEIRSFMDFDELLSRRNALVHKRQTMLKTGVGILVSAVVVITFFVFNSPEKPSVNPGENDSTVKNELPDFDTPSYVEENEDSPEDDDLKPEGPDRKTEDGEATALIRSEREIRQEKKKSSGAGMETDESASAKEDVYVQAEPVDGYENLFAYFRNNLKYPVAALKDSIQGVMKVSFIIDENGKPVNVRVDETLGAPFEVEAMKLIESMPPWKAALLNDKPVRSRISLPLTFEIKSVTQ